MTSPLLDTPLYTSLIDLLRHQTQINGSKVCFSLLANGTEVTESITYAELDARARAIAVELRTLAKPSDRAMLLMPNGIDYIVGFWGCVYAGIVAVTAYPPQHKRRDWGRLNSILGDCDAALVLSSVEHEVSVASWLLESSHQCKQFVVGKEFVPLAEQWEMPDVHSETLAYLQYSSGSTGSPKGVMLGHGNLIHNTALIAQEFSLDDSSNCVTWLPMYHDMGFVGGVLSPMGVGASVWLLPPPVVLQTPFLWLKAISDYKAVMSGGPNFIYEHCVARVSDEQKQALDLSAWRFAANGAEPIHTQTLVEFSDAFAQCGLAKTALKPCYGMAETCLFVTASAHEAQYRSAALDSVALQKGRIVASGLGRGKEAVVHAPSSGRINDQMSIRIVDPETKSALADDQVGEIWVRGESVAQGYWNKPEATANTFDNELEGEAGYLRTGDLGFVLDGWLYVSGRAKEVVIVNGRNLYPQDIEATVQSVDKDIAPHGGAVFETPDNQVVLVQELTRRGMRRDDLDQIILSIRQAVAEVHEISFASIVLIKPVSLPKTTSGKIQRLKTRALYLDGEFAVGTPSDLSIKSNVIALWQASSISKSAANHAEHPAPAPLLPEWVAGDDAAIRDWVRAWIAIRLDVSVDKIDPTQKLVATGLDSVDAMTLTHELSQIVDSVLSPDLIWQYPTINELVAFLAAFRSEAFEEDLMLEGEI
ncbi:AMP-binding protein [Marinomonas mediterranea]|uniref:AMP-binding protein n=1 Tax=Marinomonas mediterranea TaxID=119864 RepID=UPI0023499047|nr:AMP-binding protein [Marinomonas mediterranea]WCN08291.1 AMP-binding protein [Marinomonas mediterranea]